jgi:hypothetical protein
MPLAEVTVDFGESMPSKLIAGFVFLYLAAGILREVSKTKVRILP